MNETCEVCLFSVDYGESTLYIKCELKGNRKNTDHGYVEKNGRCDRFTPSERKRHDRV